MRFQILAVPVLIASLTACSAATAEASTELDLKKLRPFLKAVQSLIESGFGDAQIDQIEQDFGKLAMDGSKTMMLPIRYQGEKVELRVVIRKEDVDTVEIRFFGPPKLAEQITQTMLKL